MPKFGWCRFAEDKYGRYARYHNLKFKMFGTVPLGIEVRRTIRKTAIDTSKAVTFRVRRGNGFYGSVAGKRYQDKFKYPGGTNVDNPEGEPYRRQWIAAVHKWKYDLTEAQKKAYNNRAVKGLRMSGYNLFMREAMKGLVEMYVDRGDPAVYDYDKNDLTKDGAWHDLDLSSIVPAGAKAVLLVGHVEGNAVDWEIRFRKNGNTNEVNHGGMETIRANVERCRLIVVAVDTDRVVEYNADNKAWANLDLAVRAWWT